jgi:hypothetical protein
MTERSLYWRGTETAKASGHEPHSWLNHVMRELPKAREMKSYDHLLPWNLSADDLITRKATPPTKRLGDSL